MAGRKSKSRSIDGERRAGARHGGKKATRRSQRAVKAGGVGLPYKRILVPLDGSRASFTALREGLAFARHLGATVVAYHLLEEAPVPFFDVAPGAIESHREHAGNERTQMRRYFKTATRLAELSGVDIETAFGRTGTPAEGIARAAQRTHCDLIVLRSRGLNKLGRLVLGSVTSDLIKRARVPVLVMPDRVARSRRTPKAKGKRDASASAARSARSSRTGAG